MPAQESRVELWSDLEPLGGTRLVADLRWSQLVETNREDGDDSCLLVFPFSGPARTLLAQNTCVRVLHTDGLIAEYPVLRVGETVMAGSVTVNCAAPRSRLNGVLIDDGTITDTVANIFAYIVSQGGGGWPGWLSAGTLASAGTLSITLSGDNAVTALKKLVQAIDETLPDGDPPCVMAFVPTISGESITGYVVNILTTVTAGTCHFLEGKQCTVLGRQQDWSDATYPATAYQLNVADVYRVNPARFPNDKILAFQTARFESASLGVDVTSRIVSVVTDQSDEAKTTVELGTPKRRFTRNTVTPIQVYQDGVLVGEGNGIDFEGPGVTVEAPGAGGGGCNGGPLKVTVSGGGGGSNPGAYGDGYTGSGNGYAPIDIVGTTASLAPGDEDYLEVDCPAVFVGIRVSVSQQCRVTIWDRGDYAAPYLDDVLIPSDTPLELRPRLTFANADTPMADVFDLDVTSDAQPTVSQSLQENFSQPTSPSDDPLNARTFLNIGSGPTWQADAEYIINKHTISSFTFKVAELSGAPTHPALVTNLSPPMGWNWVRYRPSFYCEVASAGDFGALKAVFRSATANNHSSWEVVMSKVGDALHVDLNWINSSGSVTTVDSINLTLPALPAIASLQPILTLDLSASPDVSYRLKMDDGADGGPEVSGTFTADTATLAYPGWSCDTASDIVAETPIAGVLTFVGLDFGTAPATGPIDVTVRALPLYYVALPP